MYLAKYTTNKVGKMTRLGYCSKVKKAVPLHRQILIHTDISTNKKSLFSKYFFNLILRTDFMKKNDVIKALFWAATLPVLGLASCSDDENTVIDEETVVNDDATAIALANGAYGPLQRLSSSFSFIIELQSDQLISFEGEEEEAGPVNSRFEQDENTWYQVKIFNYLYTSITNDNTTITEVTKAYEKGKVSESVYEAAIGKAKLLRGLAYLYLVQLWGEVPVYTEQGGSQTERLSIDEVYAQIVQDLTDAEELLADYSGDPVAPSKQAAEALLARAYLAWGYNPLSASQVAAIADAQQDPALSTDATKLQQAYSYAKKVIESGKLKLASDFSKLYGRDYESNKLGDNEHLFTIHHDGDSYDAQGNHQTHCSWTYPYQNGQNSQGFQQNHTEVADVDLYYGWKEAEPNDKRLSKTYIIAALNPEDNYTYAYDAPYYTPINGKGYDESYDDSENKEILYNSVDRIEVRYAEVLLTAAEALVQLGRSTEAATYLNQLRTRAGLEAKATPTFSDIKNEWTYEFTYEQKSLLNHYRWKDLIANVQNVANYTHYDLERVKADAEAYPQAAAFWQKVYTHLHAKYNNVKGKHYRQPIPLGLSGEVLGIEQNPGY